MVVGGFGRNSLETWVFIGRKVGVELTIWDHMASWGDVTRLAGAAPKQPFNILNLSPLYVFSKEVVLSLVGNRLSFQNSRLASHLGFQVVFPIWLPNSACLLASILLLVNIKPNCWLKVLPEILRWFCSFPRPNHGSHIPSWFRTIAFGLMEEHFHGTALHSQFPQGGSWLSVYMHLIV